MKMAAIYARVSSEQQREENTIASQTASLIEFAKSHDLEVPKEWVFEDEGYSGATLERPGLERVRDLAPRAHLHQPMPVPKQLPQIPILRTRYPDSREIIFPQQSQQQSGVLTVGLLLADSLGLNLRRIADPYLDTQFYQ